MSVAEKRKVTPVDYLAVERKAETKSEYLDGEVFAMAGGTHRHSLIGTNLAGELRSALKVGTCQVQNSDVRVLVRATGLYAYPDISVGCGKLEFEDEHQDTLLNPQLLVEVWSETTAATDRGQKFWHYRELESLRDYVLVSQYATLVEHFARQPDGSWLLRDYDQPGQTLKIDSLGVQVPLTEIYAGVEMER
ncbi:MAG TPA: hypothetical protein DCY13_06870 [Verrucomicrobiales bacterium]|nr:hypothetical protein [Verrucomicrobiales bacterium]